MRVYLYSTMCVWSFRSVVLVPGQPQSRMKLVADQQWMHWCTCYYSRIILEVDISNEGPLAVLRPAAASTTLAAVVENHL